MLFDTAPHLSWAWECKLTQPMYHSRGLYVTFCPAPVLSMIVNYSLSHSFLYEAVWYSTCWFWSNDGFCSSYSGPTILPPLHCPQHLSDLAPTTVNTMLVLANFFMSCQSHISCLVRGTTLVHCLLKERSRRFHHVFLHKYFTRCRSPSL